MVKLKVKLNPIDERKNKISFFVKYNTIKEGIISLRTSLNVRSP